MRVQLLFSELQPRGLTGCPRDGQIDDLSHAVAPRERGTRLQSPFP